MRYKPEVAEWFIATIFIGQILFIIFFIIVLAAT